MINLDLYFQFQCLITHLSSNNKQRVITSFPVFQFKEFLGTYNKVTENCFMDCVKDFTTREVKPEEVNRKSLSQLKHIYVHSRPAEWFIIKHRGSDRLSGGVMMLRKGFAQWADDVMWCHNFSWLSDQSWACLIRVRSGVCLGGVSWCRSHDFLEL